MQGDFIAGGTYIYIGNKHNYIKYVGTGNVAYEMWAQTVAGGGTPSKRISFSYGANNNVLHGAWASDQSLGTSSDINVKKNVAPLYQSLLQTHLEWRER